MTLPTSLATIARAMIIVAVPLVLIVTPLYLFFAPGYVRWAYRQPGFPDADRFAAEERARLSDANVGYLRGMVTREELAALRTDDGELAMRGREISHMSDVKAVTDAFFSAHAIACVMLIVGAAILALGQAAHALGHALRTGMVVTASLVVLLVLASVVDFSTFFTQFHRVFFREGSWLFYWDDTLIQLYPLVFWSQTMLRLGATILIEAGFLCLISALLLRGQRPVSAP